MTYSLLCVLCGEFRHTLYVDECFDDLADSETLPLFLQNTSVRIQELNALPSSKNIG